MDSLITHLNGIAFRFDKPSRITQETASQRPQHASRHVCHARGAGEDVPGISRRMSGSLTRGGEEDVPGFPATWATRNFAYLTRGQWAQ